MSREGMAVATTVRVTGRRLALRHQLSILFLYTLATLLSLIILFPIYWMLLTSLKLPEEVAQQPYLLFPAHVHVYNYLAAWQSTDFARYFFNSGVISISSALLEVGLCGAAGYAFARLRFPGRGVLFALTLATIMVPPQVTIVPLFVLLKNLPFLGGNDWSGQGGIGLLDSYPGLLVPHVVGAFGIFLMRQFFLTLPGELADAARIDGAGEFAIAWRIYLPLTWPAVATLGIVSFQDTWNDFLWPLVVTKSDAMKTLQLALSIFQQEYNTQWTLLMAATTMICVPIVVLFMLFQRSFKQGVVLSGLKG
jgi:multiple sugar transport system permease protein